MKTIAIIGAGASGVFCASAIENKNLKKILIEASHTPLSKLRLTGGGRCNFTNEQIVKGVKLDKFYPRGANNLRKLFFDFDCDTCKKFFSNIGIENKTEENGRVFPLSDSADKFADSLLEYAKKNNAEILTNTNVQSISKQGEYFEITISDSRKIKADYLLISCGGNWTPTLKHCVENLGHNFTDFAPSMFPITVEESQALDWQELAGASLKNAEIFSDLNGKNFKAEGDILFTHTGLSGPAVLAFTAYAAPEMKLANYKADIFLKASKSLNETTAKLAIESLRKNNGKSKIKNARPPELSANVWNWILKISETNPDTLCNSLSKESAKKIASLLVKIPLKMTARSAHKGEFVTCGGVERKEINFSNMESRICPNLFFAGECIDIDAITGGFNLHAAWANANAVAKYIDRINVDV